MRPWGTPDPMEVMTFFREPWYEEGDAEPKKLARGLAEAHRALSSRLLEISHTPSDFPERKKIESVLCLLEATIKEINARNAPK